MSTLSEKLFEKYCDANGITWKSIPEDDIETPDYSILVDSIDIIIEVKEFLLPERPQLHSTDKPFGQVEWFRGTGHIRVRNKISKANSQIGERTKGHIPGMLIIYDDTYGRYRITYEDFLNAMYGNESVDIEWPQDPHISDESRIVAHRFGGRRKMTPQSNRNISAIGLMRTTNSEIPTLVIFHNIHAHVPLSADLAGKISKKQYSIDRENPNYQFWSEISK